MIRNIVLVAGLLALVAGAVQARPPHASPAAVAPSPAKIGGRAAAAYLARPDIVPLRTTVARGVHYADVASDYGAARLAEATGGKALLDRRPARPGGIAVVRGGASGSAPDPHRLSRPAFAGATGRLKPST